MAPERAIQIERIAVPIGLVVSMIVTSVWVTQYLGARITSIEHRMDMIGRDIRDATTHAEMALSRRESMSWLATFRAANPTLVVPDLPPR